MQKGKRQRLAGRLLRLAGAAFLVFAISSVVASGIDYEPSTLEQMIGLADLIIVGTINDVGQQTIRVTIRESVSEEPFAEVELEIVRYVDYTHLRPHGYVPGQMFVWFLSWRSEAGILGSRPRWHVSGFEGEGELPVDNDNVYLKGGLLPWLPTEEGSVHGQWRSFQSYDRALFWDAVISYRHCVRWVRPTEEDPPEPEVVCTEGELHEYRDRSCMHWYLLAGTPRT